MALTLILLAWRSPSAAVEPATAARATYPAAGWTPATATMVLDDAWIDGPAGVPGGGHTGLRLFLANHPGRPDALTGISTTIAARARLMLHGKPVRRIQVGAWRARDLEWRSNKNGVELVGLTSTVEPGQWFDATFRVAHSLRVTTQITVAPLASRMRTGAAGSSTGPSTAPTGDGGRRRPGA